MIDRPERFARMGAAFGRAFGNADGIFRIDGVIGKPVRIIARKMRVTDFAEESDQDVEATLDSVSVSALAVPGLTSQRDAVTIDGVLYGIRNIEDDGRAMLKLTFREKLT
ncbi:head-tail joining protein [Shinella sp. M31]|uniref:head-tail joining protein n=1 Tax=Shinella sp. M31 TaxID=3368615 RepID=UPI003BA2146B